MLVLGPSGVGKSSVAQAGVLAKDAELQAAQQRAEAATARVALNDQLADLRSFWSHTGSRDSPTILGET